MSMPGGMMMSTDPDRIVAIMAFAEANKGGKYDAVIKNGEAFIKGIQHEDDESKPSHGGFSYPGVLAGKPSSTGGGSR